MSSAGGTRAGSAAFSRRAKEEIIRVLFGRHQQQQQQQHVKPADGMSYTYSELKRAYLRRIQEIHPDKHKAKKLSSSRLPLHRSLASSSLSPAVASPNNKNTNNDMERYHRQFTELQQAWDRYETLVKSLKKDMVGKDNDDETDRRTDTTAYDANFTLFGVGCSFSDSDAERNLRNEITDQACRGWFSSGALAENTSSTNTITTSREEPPRPYIPLADDDMFVQVIVEETHGSSYKGNLNNTSKVSSRRPSLVGDFRPRQHR
jgi:curved DNA-binding protein CbpA